MKFQSGNIHGNVTAKEDMTADKATRIKGELMVFLLILIPSVLAIILNIRLHGMKRNYRVPVPSYYYEHEEGFAAGNDLFQIIFLLKNGNST